MRSVRILPVAEAELAAAASWYESRCVGLGVDFVACVLGDLVEMLLERGVDARGLRLAWATALPTS